MSEFIERIIRAIEDNEGDGTAVQATAALAAMEQPSQKMIDAGKALDDGDFGRVATAEEHWRAMVLAELKP